MSDKPKVYRQCHMKLEGKSIYTTGWIEERGAKVGAKVELLPQGRFWEVVEVYDVPMPGDILAETQRQRRKAPPSIRNTKKDRKQQEAAL